MFFIVYRCPRVIMVIWEQKFFYLVRSPVKEFPLLFLKHHVKNIKKTGYNIIFSQIPLSISPKLGNYIFPPIFCDITKMPRSYVIIYDNIKIIKERKRSVKRYISHFFPLSTKKTASPNMH